MYPLHSLSLNALLTILWCLQKNKVLGVDEAAECIWKQGIASASVETGTFLDWKGDLVPW